MDTLKLYTEDAGDGTVNFVIEGDPQAFVWLLSAAGNARDGFENNSAMATDGTPRRLVLRPETPLEQKDQAPRNRTRHLVIDNPAARAARAIKVTPEQHQAIPDHVLAELALRGTTFEVLESPPAPTPPTPPTQPTTPGVPPPTSPPSPPSPPTPARDELDRQARDAGDIDVATLKTWELAAVLDNDTETYADAGKVIVPDAFEELRRRARAGDGDAYAALEQRPQFLNSAAPAPAG